MGNAHLYFLLFLRDKGVKTDTIFYQLFESFPSCFFDLIGQSSSVAEAYKFTSVEIKQLAFRIDGLFLPNEDDSTSPIYFLEVQFQPDARFYHPFLAKYSSTSLNMSVLMTGGQ